MAPGGSRRRKNFKQTSIAQHWARDWRALALTQVHHWSRLSDSREDGEALSSVHSTALAAGKLIHNLLCDGRVKKERNKTDNPREGWEDGTPPPHRDFLRRGECGAIAIAHPWASASSYLSSQSLSDSRCNLYATPRSSYSHRSPSRRFFLCRSALPCLVLHRHCCLSVPCSRVTSPGALGAPFSFFRV